MSRSLLFYKPYGVLSTFTDEARRSTLRQSIHTPDVYAAGRRVLTNDAVEKFRAGVTIRARGKTQRS